MKNINTIINKVKEENDKNKNFAERLMRKKPSNVMQINNIYKPPNPPTEVYLDATEILKITLNNQQEYKYKLKNAEDEKNGTTIVEDNELKELNDKIRILEKNVKELRNELVLMNSSNNNKNEKIKQLEMSSHKELQLLLKYQEEVKELNKQIGVLKKELEFKSNPEIKNNKLEELNNNKEIHELNKEIHELKKQVEIKNKKEYELTKQFETQKKKNDEIITNLETQIKNLNSEKELFLSSKQKEVEEQSNAMLNEKKTTIKIVNIYQQFFAYNRKATGWGDIIRGSYFLMQYCEDVGLDFDMDMSYHPISRFLEKYRKMEYNKELLNEENENMKKNVYKNVVKFDETNFTPKITSDKIILSNHRSIKEIKYKFVKYLNISPFYPDYIDTNIDVNENNSKPLNTKYIHTITFPIYNITYLQKERMKQEVEPCDELKVEVENIMATLELVEERYVVLHIRCGDTYLLNKNNFFSKTFLSKVKQEVKNWLDFLEDTRGTMINMNNSPDEDAFKTSVFCIADNNYIKQIILNEFPYFKTLFFDIKHVGEGQKLEEENLKNTVIEFTIMSKSKSIFGISSYNHGSGFSKWCAETYSIPYMCKYVPNDN